MPVRRPSRVAGAVTGYAAGCALVVAGVAMQWGTAPALMFAGALVAISCLLLGDVGGD